MMSRILLQSSSSVLVFLLLCLSHECNGRHLTAIDDDIDKAKILNHSTTKGFGSDGLQLTVPDLQRTAKVKNRIENDDIDKRTDCGSESKKLDKIKNQKVNKFKDRHQRKHNSSVPPKNKQVHQQPGFDLDYSPPKTHPPSHN